MVFVDQELCSGCGLCMELCPEVFALGPEGKAFVQKQECENHDIEQVSDQCPMECIDF